jgi:hypothetical protein
MSDFETVADICDSEGVSAHRIEYIIGAKRIRPLGKVGATRIFSKEAANQIRVELQRIDKHHAECRCIGDPAAVPMT